MNGSFRKDILSKPFYWVCIAFISCLSYLFDITNRTVSVDNLAKPIYLGKEKALVSGTRWGSQLWHDLLCITADYTPFHNKFLAVVLLIIAAVLFSRVLYIFLNQNKYCLALCTIFSCIYISYPLIAEIWAYDSASFILSANASAAACVILMLYDKDKLFSRYTILSALLLSVVVSSYEVSAFLYVTAVLCVILLDYILFNKKNWLQKGFQYAIPLFFAVLLRFVIAFGLLQLLNLEYVHNGETSILWRPSNIGSLLVQNLSQTLDKYFARSLISYPIFVFVTAWLSGSICAIVISIKKKDFTIFLLSVFVILSLFLQSMIQGNVLPYRTTQTIQFFNAFAMTMVLYALTYVQKHSILTAAFIFFGYLTYRQGAYLNMSLALNNQRSDNEAAIVYNVGTRLKKDFDEKPVIFTGETSLGNNIEHQITPDKDSPGWRVYSAIAIRMGWEYEDIELYDTNINSLLNWSSQAFQSQRMMKEYFSYYGFDIMADTLTLDENEIFIDQALKSGGDFYPYEIRDLGDVLVVNIGSSIISAE